MKKTAILIGFGGMGKRYFKTLKLMKFNVLAICDKNKKNFINHRFDKKTILTTDFKSLLKHDADLLCVATNTDSRFDILEKFIKKKKIKKIITEKPLASSLWKCKKIFNVVKKNKVRIVINTHRTFSPNYMMLKNIFKKINQEITSIIINSPSAGLGNMGSTFFDFGFYFFESNPVSVFGSIDRTKTINPRGKQYKDPGGYGVINFQDNKKLFFDLSENTGLPYIINLKSKNCEIKYDEINNDFEQIQRPKFLEKKPLYFYVFKPKKKKLKLKHKFDVAKMTKFSINHLFKKKFNYNNLIKSIKIMECIFAVHVSSAEKRIVKLPLSSKYLKLNVNFA